MKWIKNWNFKRKNRETGKKRGTENDRETGKHRAPWKAGAGGWCAWGAGGLVGLWTFLMLAVFPFYMKNHYSKLGVRKFEFFLAVSLGCLLPAAALGLAAFWRRCISGRTDGAGQPESMKMQGGSSGQDGRRQRCSLQVGPLDGAMLLYAAAAVVSWLGSVDRATAWTGVSGWFAGLRSQLLFVLIYVLASRFFPWKKILLAAYLAGSGGTFVLGILHRFGADPLGMYVGIAESYQLRFLSTIGQATWYSSYVCTLLVVGVTLFFVSERLCLRVITGIYCMLGFATLVTQNSDSAFAALVFLFFGLFLAACDSMVRMEHFFETVLLALGSFKIVGLFQQFLPERAMKLGGLSEFLSQSTQTWLLFLGVCVLYMAFLFYRQAHPDMEVPPAGKQLRRLAAAALLAGLFFFGLLVWLNTTGMLETWFGFHSRNQYLLFDQNWGNSRGFTWSFVAGAFAAFPFWRKLIGIGPDCFSLYCYADPELGACLDHFFGQNQTLTNAHNEFLNTLFNMGIVGLTAFLLVFVTAFLRFYRKRKECPLALAGMLAVLTYGAHNFFCYQQVCCTPFFFLILGMAEHALMQRGPKDVFAMVSRDGAGS